MSSLHQLRLLLIALLLCGAAACLPPTSALPPLPSDTPGPPTATPTPTIVWFPPTATYTPLPTATLSLTPTLDTRPLFGALEWQDDFSQPELWTLGKLPEGTIAVTQGSLSIVVSRPRAYLSSLRQGTSLGDFYLEVTASPSICRGADEYGLLLRVKPGPSFFRFGLTCDGRARLDRILDGQASSPHPPELSGAVPPGAPSASRLAVWASGRELRFYANDQYLFSARDPGLFSGSVGLFARASSPDMVSVTFSDLSVYAVAAP